MTGAPDRAALAQLLEPVLGGPVEIERLERLSGGASRETWSFDALLPDGTTRGLVLRRDPRANHYGQTQRSTEYALLRAAAGAGVPVPETLALLPADSSLGDGFVMGRIEGETIARRILRDDDLAPARAVMAQQCGEIAARIHAVDASKVDGLQAFDAATLLQQQRAFLDTFGEPHPAFELGLRELSKQVPAASAPPRLVHGDFRNGNFIVGPEGIRAVLDWELAHLGDPVEDLGWLCVKSWRFGVRDRVVGGFGDVDDLLDAYGRASGVEVDPDALRFWIAYGTIRWGVIALAQAFTHLHGIVRSVELATLGRRVAEMEWDLLQLLDGKW